MRHKDFLDLVLPFKDKVFRLAKRLLVSREEAEDVTQEILLKLWQNKNKIQGYNNIEVFSMSMTKNLCLDRLKSKQTNNLRIVHNNYVSKSNSLQKQVELENSIEWVSKIIENLPKQQKIIIQLRDIEQYDYDDIAKMLDMSETAIRVALSRARKTIRKQLIETHNYGIR